MKTLAQLNDLMLATLTARGVTLSVEHVPLTRAHQRYLARDIKSTINVPAFDVSAMDGFAVVLGDSQDSSQGWELIGEAKAGSGYEATLMTGLCVRIMTGAPIPNGANTVLIQENAEMVNNTVYVKHGEQIRESQHIRYCGEEITQGQTVLSAHTLLHSRHIMLLASIGVATVPVYAPLSIALCSSGDELVLPSVPLQAGQIYDANRFGLEAVLAHPAFSLKHIVHLPDDITHMTDMLTELSASVDVLITTGGVSVGRYDYLKAVVENIGEVSTHKVAIKPGKPFTFGSIGKAVYVGLPGNPVSAWVGMQCVVLPLLHYCAGGEYQPTAFFYGKLTHDVKASQDRLDIQRAKLIRVAGEMTAIETVGSQDSHRVLGLAHADALVFLKEGQSLFKAGDIVPFLPL